MANVQMTIDQQHQALAMIAGINARLTAMREQRDRALAGELDAMIKAKVEEEARKVLESTVEEQRKTMAALRDELMETRKQAAAA